MIYTIFISILVLLPLFFIKFINAFQERFLLLLVLALASFHIYFYKTDAEDAYIAYRYAQNFANGNGFVFNPGEYVEGYSDFFWVILLGTTHKITGAAIPLLARAFGIIFTLIVIFYTYYISKRLSNDNKKLSLMVVLLLSCSGSFIAYASGGLESPLFSLQIVGFIHLLLIEKWLAAGVLVALATMTRPEGILMSFPILIAVLTGAGTVRRKIVALLKSISGILVILMPWTFWRLSCYGYLLPNPMAAKAGMDKAFQIQLGLNYFIGHWFRVSLPFFIAITTLIFISIEKWKVFITIFSLIFIYVLLYLFIGGDWMPAYRFYSPFYPVFVLLICQLLSIGWKDVKPNYILKVLNLYFLVSAFYMLNVSFKDKNMMPEVHLWREQVTGLADIGKWFKNSLPINTVVATFPNGAFSFYNELYTIDMVGLTDEHIARKGLRRPRGMPGHIAHDEFYVLGRAPDIIAVMNGQGFEKDPINNVPFPYEDKYDAISFQFTEGTNKCGNYVNILTKKTRTKEFIRLFSRHNIIVIRN